MVVEEVYGAGGLPTVVVLVSMLTYCTVSIIARVIASRVASTGAPHVCITPLVTQLHTEDQNSAKNLQLGI